MFPRNFANLPQPSQQDLQAPPAPPHALGAPPVPGFAPTGGAASPTIGGCSIKGISLPTLA